MNVTVVLLTVIAPHALKEKLVESLLEHKVAAVAGFGVRDRSTYGLHVPFHNIAEQISGRTNEIELTLLLPASDAPGLVAHLHQAFQGQRVAYRISPVTETGSIS